MSSRRRIGVFGGTFDPVHEAHLDIARAALAHAGLDLVLFVVSGRPPHKQHGPATTSKDRYDMVAAAVADQTNLGVSRIEIDREGPSYTVDTMRDLVQHFPDASFWLIVGMDALMDFPGWREPEGILKLARLLVVPRPGDWSIPAALEPYCDVLPFAETELSSTEVRRRLASGEPVELIVPPPVMDIIRDRKLYGYDETSSAGR